MKDIEAESRNQILIIIRKSKTRRDQVQSSNQEVFNWKSNTQNRE